ncbi:LytR C-terminal domain-containing protein [Agromyces archimandritae]|uniref:LytR C-terminal domain-containing protein n=1 Tax=Agromyces archimandritae TaxID=2781962 RepID=A0A975FMZ9_9MICO|nr:LytR C-terminal domain-containing protein [Agromyces archimandritae]QTX03991.1 LytR C-terminal domain-containing protein [Agromyces archimandritae]
MAEPEFPRDRFDSVPRGIERVGAHRAPVRRRGWVGFVWAAAATVVLAGAGIVAVMMFNDRLDIAEPSAASTGSPSPTVEPTIDAAVPVIVLNGTETAGLAAQAAEVLGGSGITIASTANADESDIAETVVYYVRPELEGAARGVAGLLPESEVKHAESFAEMGAEIVVVLGGDYATAVGG